MLDLSHTTRDAIVEHARQHAPEEACGVVLGTPNGETGRERYVPCENIAADRTAAFEIDAGFMAEARASGELRAIVHSHPHGLDGPSKTDMAQAAEDDVPWGIPYSPGDPLPIRPHIPGGTYTLPGHVHGFATVSIEEGATRIDAISATLALPIRTIGKLKLLAKIHPPLLERFELVAVTQALAAAAGAVFAPAIAAVTLGLVGPTAFTGRTGRGPSSSSTSAAGCQYIRISLPAGSLRPVRVIRSFCSWLIMAVSSFRSREDYCRTPMAGCRTFVRRHVPAIENLSTASREARRHKSAGRRDVFRRTTCVFR